MAGQTMAEKRIGPFLLLEAGDMVGIVTATQVGSWPRNGFATSQ